MTSPRNRSIALYGTTGSGKTVQAARFARYIYESTGRITRYIGCDSGDWRSVIDPYIQAGVIEPLSIHALVGLGASAFALAHRLGRGEWFSIAPDGKLLAHPPGPATWERVGAIIIDSGTGLAQTMQDEMQRAAARSLTAATAKPPLPGEQPSTASMKAGVMVSGKEATYVYSIDGEVVSGGSWDDIRGVQTTIKRLVAYFSTLPLAGVCWTFREYSGMDKLTGNKSYGPEVVGRAATVSLPSDLGMLIHCDVFVPLAQPQPGAPGGPATGAPKPLVDASPIARRMYYLPHPDEVTGVPYPAKPRVPPELEPRLQKDWPHGYLEPRVDLQGVMTNGLDTLLHREDEILVGLDVQYTAWKQGVDALRAPAPPAPLVEKGGAETQKSS